MGAAVTTATAAVQRASWGGAGLSLARGWDPGLGSAARRKSALLRGSCTPAPLPKTPGPVLRVPAGGDTGAAGIARR